MQYYSLYVVFYLRFSHLIRLFNCISFMHICDEILGHPVLEALRYKPEGCEFDSRWCLWNFSLTLFFRSHYGPVFDTASN
jgi:hypothetical protein